MLNRTQYYRNRNNYVMQGITKAGASIKGGDSNVYSLGKVITPTGDLEILRNGAYIGAGTSIFVDNEGIIYAATSGGSKYKWNGSTWVQMADADYALAKLNDIDNISTGGGIMTYVIIGGVGLGAVLLIKKLFFSKKSKK